LEGGADASPMHRSLTQILADVGFDLGKFPVE
jgi:hypothetical protein